MSEKIDLEAALWLADEAERVANAATPGEWTAESVGWCRNRQDESVEGFMIPELLGIGDGECSRLSEADARHIAASRTSVPALASTVRGLVERVRECPAWHKRPTCPGIWFWADSEMETGGGLTRVVDPETYFTEKREEWFGPISMPNPEESTNA